MSILWKFQPLVVNTQLAMRVGLNESMIVQQLSYWIYNVGAGVEHNGQRWVYNTVSQWQEQFPFWAPNTIRRAFKKLETLGIVSSEKINRANHDHTLYYTINESHPVFEDEPSGQIDLPKMGKSELPKMGKSDLPKMGKSAYSNWANLTENTTENSSKNSTENNPPAGAGLSGEEAGRKSDQAKPTKAQKPKSKSKSANSESGCLTLEELEAERPECLSAETLKAYFDYRKTKKLIINRAAWNTLKSQTVKIHEAGYDVDEAYGLAMLNNWRGILLRYCDGMEKRAEVKAAVPVKGIIELYHRACPKMPQVRAHSPRLEQYLAERWNQDPKFQSREFWEKFFDEARRKAANNWKIPVGRDMQEPYLELLVRADVFLDVIEGRSGY